MWRACVFAEVHMSLPCDWSDTVHESLLRGLFKSNSWIAIVMITDLFGSTQRFNVPGAIAETNWSARLPQTVEAMRADVSVSEKMGRIAALVRESGRSG
jgi:4-alpha-glucanotransferase